MDADWAGGVNDRKSMSGYLIFFGNTLISWTSSKQRTIARYSTEVEYKALTDSIAEVIFSIYCQICKLLLLLCLRFGVTTWVLFIYL